ncbi:MAG: sulfatase-like hydrolase/transferase [Bacteroidales bacterium]|nr:sulfatase-like hydrolase/transferase [Bacteroidales bacterium]
MNASYRKKKKINWHNIPVVQLLFRLLMVLLLFSVSRWLIYLFNTDFFHHLTLGQALRLYLTGMRFDLVVIAYANLPLILYYCLPFKFIYKKGLQSVMGFYFIFVNSVIILLNMVDVIYFRFIGKRMTSELFQFFGNSDENIWAIVGQVVVDYWFMLVLMVLFVLVLVVVSKRTRLEAGEDTGRRWTLVQCLSLLVFAFLTIIAARGGLQNKPVNMSTALRYADSQNVPIVLNTPFTIAKSSTSQGLKELHYEGLEDIDFSPVHFSSEANRFVADSLDFKPNVMYIVLESIGQEMIGYYNPDRRYPLTPFLDTLLSQSLTFDGRANGRRSIEALPSLLSGIPSLMDVDFTSSPYFSNRIDGLGKTLKEQGYVTAMFHGGNNGTMNFDIYAQNAGFDRYYGRSEYGNDDDFDGRWGIFDGPFLQYTLHTVDTFQQPFAAVVYTLSSHHPYTLPKGFELPKESYLWSGFEKTVYYADCALRDFFVEAATKPWFDSTLFVITADHANTEHYLPEYSNIWGMYSIPIAFYMPTKIAAHRSDELAQQTDLNLSIIAALGINDTVFSFGRNLFDTLTRPSSIAYINQTYQFSDGRYLLQSDGDNTIGVFNMHRDRQVDDNLIDRIQCEDLAMIMKKIIQEYNNRFINNQLFVDKEAYHEQAKDTLYLEPGGGEIEQE